MSNNIILSSQDVSTGESSDGSLNLPTTLNGVYKVELFYFTTASNINWIWSGVNTFAFTTYPPVAIPMSPPPKEFTVTLDLAPLQDTEDLVAIANSLQIQLQAAFDIQAAEHEVYGRTVTVTEDPDAKTIHLNFDDSVVIRWNNSSSTINEVFGKAFYEDAKEEQNTDFTLSAMNITLNPEMLEFYIAESNSLTYTTHNTFPTLIFLTTDINSYQTLSSTFKIVQDVNTIHFQIFLPYITYEPVPLNKQWIMYLRQLE